jgi:hypothetical protein
LWARLIRRVVIIEVDLGRALNVGDPGVANFAKSGDDSMAVMIPETCPSKATVGERTLFATLHEKLGDDCWAWYEPIVGNRFPDFVVLGPAFGLLLIEQKGWYADEIVAADNYNFSIKRRGSNADEVHQSPLRQSKGYLDRLLSTCKMYPVLMHASGPHKGQPVFPMGSCVVMSNITREQARQPGPRGGPALVDVLPEQRVIFGDELRELRGMSDSKFARRMRELFTVNFEWQALTEQQVSTIRGILHPEVVVRRVVATSDCVASTALASATGDVLLTLDERQEQLARSIGDGHRVFYGVAGSGKTILLLARAKLLAEAGERRVLVLCFNKVLASWLRSVIAEGVITNPKHAAIKVLHFHAWASQILGRLGFLEDIAEKDKDRILGERLLNGLEQPGSKRYDSILVDEAQMFDPTWFNCCVKALGDLANGNGANGNLMIVSDGIQSLYRRNKFKWKDVGVNASGRTSSKKFHLDVNYRSTRQILEAAWSVLQPIYPGGGGEAETLEDTFPVVTPDIARAARSGPRPRLVKGVLDVNMICQEIRDLMSQGYCAQDIALIYRKHANGLCVTAELLKGVREELGQDSNIGAIWITETEKTKERFSASDRGVRILTAHSALGLDFKAVVIVGLDLFQYGNGGIQKEERKLLYVAMTRAQERLVLLHERWASPMLRELQDSDTVDTDGA